MTVNCSFGKIHRRYWLTFTVEVIHLFYTSCVLLIVFILQKDNDWWLQAHCTFICRCHDGKQGHHDPQRGPVCFCNLDHSAGRPEKWPSRRNWRPSGSTGRIINAVSDDHFRNGTNHIRVNSNDYPFDGDVSGSNNYDYDGHDYCSSTIAGSFPTSMSIIRLLLSFVSLNFRIITACQMMSFRCTMTCGSIRILTKAHLPEESPSMFQ